MTAPQATPSVDPTTAAMMQPLPEAPLQHALEDARQQIARGRLTEPQDANAFDSVLLAWHTDSTHPDVATAIDELTLAFSEQIVRSVKDGKDERVRELASRATALGQQTGTANSKAQQQLREATSKALDARLQLAVKRRDTTDVQRLTTLAEQLEMPRKLDPRLIAKAKALPPRAWRAARPATPPRRAAQR